MALEAAGELSVCVGRTIIVDAIVIVTGDDVVGLDTCKLVVD
jgi:hypothetical protein